MLGCKHVKQVYPASSRLPGIHRPPPIGLQTATRRIVGARVDKTSHARLIQAGIHGYPVAIPELNALLPAIQPEVPAGHEHVHQSVRQPALQIKSYGATILRRVRHTYGQQEGAPSESSQLSQTFSDPSHETRHGIKVTVADGFTPCHAFEKDRVTEEIKKDAIHIVVLRYFLNVAKSQLSHQRLCVVHT